MTKIRQAEKAEFEANAPDMKAGLQAVKMAIQILREYYAKDNIAHTAAEGAGTGIIGLLEVVESDFSKTLAEMSATEAAAQRAYDRGPRIMKSKRRQWSRTSSTRPRRPTL